MRIEDIHQDNFTEYIQSEFHVLDQPDGSFDLKLVEISDRTAAAAGWPVHQEVFALLFHGPAGNFMRQGIYRLQHSSLGEIDLFLVPVAQDAEGFQYEAVFNRLVS